MRRTFLFLALLSVLPSTALGATFSAPVPDLVGVAESGANLGVPVSFDFGQQFSKIESVSLEIEAHVVAEQFDNCGTQLVPLDPCVHEVNLLGFFSILDEEDMPFPGLLIATLSVSEDPHATEATGTGVGNFHTPTPNPTGWDILLDGEGSLSLFWNATIFPPTTIIKNSQEGSGEIFAARVIIEGTPIPEPSTAIQIMAGLAVLAGIKQGRSHSAPPTRAIWPSAISNINVLN